MQRHLKAYRFYYEKCPTASWMRSRLYTMARVRPLLTRALLACGAPALTTSPAHEALRTQTAVPLLNAPSLEHPLLTPQLADSSSLCRSQLSHYFLQEAFPDPLHWLRGPCFWNCLFPPPRAPCIGVNSVRGTSLPPAQGLSQDRCSGTVC